MSALGASKLESLCERWEAVSPAGGCAFAISRTRIIESLSQAAANKTTYSKLRSTELAVGDGGTIIS